MMLSQIIGLNALYLFPIHVQGYDTLSASALEGQTTGSVYFPFSMLYSIYTAGDVELNRFSNFFREAGIYQAVSIFFFAYERFTRRSRFVTIGLAAGALLSLSTLGLLLLPLTGGLVYLARRRANIVRFAIAAAAAIAAVGILIFAPAIGLTDKLDTHSTSVTDRSYAISRGIDAIVTDPLGTGVYSEKVAGYGICLIASIASIGLIGFLIQFILLAGFRPGERFFGPKVITCFPLFMTALLSQPIAGAGMTYILAMVAIPAVAGVSKPMRRFQFVRRRHAAARASILDNVA
ncbi:hypothetical protein DIE16_35350 [Burkholderia sp. Bp9090]|nr:hypothetical protein DIE16_35350 [Burkholderia sp. Bp9090]